MLARDQRLFLVGEPMLQHGSFESKWIVIDLETKPSALFANLFVRKQVLAKPVLKADVYVNRFDFRAIYFVHFNPSFLLGLDLEIPIYIYHISFEEII